MLLNGVVLAIQKCLPAQYTNHFLPLIYVVGGIVSWGAAVALKRPIRLAHFGLGAAAGLVSYVGNYCLIRSLAPPSKASVVFPIVFGTSMLIVALVSVVGFKERLTPRGICAVIVGIASVVILSQS